jgi:hypothetical protein
MSTVIVTLCDEPYLAKAMQTIKDIRGVGQWTGDLVLITVGFTPSLLAKYSVQCISFPSIPIHTLREHYQANPLSIPTCDGRENKKCTQWEKLHAFDAFFSQWERVFFIDAGLRLFDSMDCFLSLEWRGKFLAPDDTWNDEKKRFNCQIETKNSPLILDKLIHRYGDILKEKYFLNCIFIYDTSLLTSTSKEEMISIMNEFPLWRTNEMGVMNVFFTFHRRVWTPFPEKAKNGRYLFDWCEYNRHEYNKIPTQWYDYCALKYPVTLPKRKTMGVAIPCYNKHIPKLLDLLESIDAQTIKPDVVSISCSSTDEFPPLRKYGFSLLVSSCKERKNAGQNRNIAARRLDTDVISFFDADDHMHPQRIEGLLVAFSEPCDIALHGYLQDKETIDPYARIQEFRVKRNVLSQCYSGCIKLDYVSRIHHSQVSVRREMFEQSQFSEEKDHEGKEDCVFCYRIFNIPGITSAYIDHPLSKYIASFTMTSLSEPHE